MLVSKDLASSGNIRSVWNHHIDYFGACCWNILPEKFDIHFCENRHQNRSRFSIVCMVVSPRTMTSHSTSLWWERRKSIIPSRQKSTNPQPMTINFLRAKTRQKKGTSNHFPTIFFPTKDFLPTGAVPKPFPPLNPPRSPRLARWPRQDTWRWIRICYKKTLGCLELQLIKVYRGVSKNSGTPKMDGLQWKSLLKWMIWGYHYFRKHP